MKPALISLALFLFPLFSFAQDGYVYNGRPQREEASTLSVFSEIGQPFYLILNGVSQNTVPQSKIRVEGLPQYANDIEIAFADKNMPHIRTNVTIADPLDGQSVNMTLKIVMARYRPLLKFVKCTEVEHNYRAAQDEYVMTYGHPAQAGPAHNDVTDNYQAPALGPTAMDPKSFSDAKKTIAAANFDDTRLSTAKAIINGNYFNTNQVMELCKLFSFDDSKLEVAKAAYVHVIDPANYFKLGNVFSFDTNKQALNDFISGQAH
jgi:hypothetical protein